MQKNNPSRVKSVGEVVFTIRRSGRPSEDVTFRQRPETPEGEGCMTIRWSENVLKRRTLVEEILRQEFAWRYRSSSRLL
jgi:hypothetical protein